MKAIIKPGRHEGVELTDVPMPEMGINDVLIKVHRTAICGTDVHIYNWDEWSQETITPPMVIGHEFVGTIEALGSNTKGFEIGDLVSGEGHITCGICRNCRAGKRHLCQNTVGVGVNRNGAFAEYVSIPAQNVWPAGNDISKDLLACFDPLGNAVHTTLSFDLVGEDVLITGAGPIGIMAVAIAKFAGARHVVITDVNKYRLELARKMGASRAVNVQEESLEDAMTELDMQEGFDVGLEMSGVESAFQAMIENMRHGGAIALLGILPSDTQVSWSKIIFNSLKIKGIYGREIFETWYKMKSMLQAGLDLSAIVTHRFRYDEYQQAFDIMRSGQSGKVILNWETL